MKNWLTIVSEVAKLESYQNGYLAVMKRMYDECIYTSEKNPIQVRYRKVVGEGADPKSGEVYAFV